MPELAISPLPEAVRRILAKRPVTSRLRSAEWQRVPAALRERAQFSAAVESARFLETVQSKLRSRIGMLAEAVGEGKSAQVDRSSFIGDLRKIALEEGIGTGTGGLTDVSSRKRLGLIYDVQTRQAAEFARWQIGSDPDLVDEFPAQELIREEERAVPRDWLARWAAAGGRFAAGRMIALKTDPIWRRLGPFGLPYPPFDWGSGMGVVDVPREECEALGLIGRGERVEPAPAEDLNAALEASAEDLSPELQDWLRAEFGDQVEIAEGRVRWKGAAA